MKIVLISGSRSDRNALEMVHRALVVAGHDVHWIVPINRVATLSFGAAYSVRNTIGYVAECLDERHNAWHSDLVVVHGDRHEILGAAVAANIMGVPIAHIGGGDITTGSPDDSFRY